MTVPVAESKDLHPASAGLYSIPNQAGTGADDSGLAVLFPSSLQRLEPRGRERLASRVEPLVEVVAARWCGVRSDLLKVPAQLVQRLCL